MGRKVRHGVGYLLAVAVYLLGRVKEHLAEFQRYEENKEKRFFDEAALARLERSIERLEELQGGQQVTVGSKLAVNGAEAAARATIRATLVDIRDDVKLYNDKDLALQKVFGRGRRLSDSSPGLLAAAAAVLAAWEVATYRARAVASGVTEETIARLESERAALRQAYREHTTEQAKGVTRTAQKTMSLNELEATCARYRQAARRVFRARPELLAQFLSLPQGVINGAQAQEPPEAPALPNGADATAEARTAKLSF